MAFSAACWLWNMTSPHTPRQEPPFHVLLPSDRGQPSRARREHLAGGRRQAPCSIRPSRSTVPGSEAFNSRRCSK